MRIITDVDARASNYMEADIEHIIRRILMGNRRVDFRESVAFVFERGLQALARGENLRGDRGVAALERQCTPAPAAATRRLYRCGAGDRGPPG